MTADPTIRCRGHEGQLRVGLPRSGAREREDRNRRNLAVALRPGEGLLTIRFADFRHCAVQASGFGELTIYALASRRSASCMEAITASKFR